MIHPWHRHFFCSQIWSQLQRYPVFVEGVRKLFALTLVTIWKKNPCLLTCLWGIIHRAFQWSLKSCSLPFFTSLNLAKRIFFFSSLSYAYILWPKCVLSLLGNHYLKAAIVLSCARWIDCFLLQSMIVLETVSSNS